MGGTSGGLYSIFFAGLSKGLLQAQEEKKSAIASPEVWARGLEVSPAFLIPAERTSLTTDLRKLALNTLYRYTRARPPSRTLVDPLAAFIITYGADPSNFLAAFNAAKEAAESTRSLEATAGRAACVSSFLLLWAGN